MSITFPGYLFDSYSKNLRGNNLMVYAFLNEMNRNRISLAMKARKARGCR